MAMPKICPICGPKLSICCLVMSAWGIIFLGILGIFFYIESAGLFEDVQLHYNMTEILLYGFEASRLETTRKYHSVAYNCWIATGFYVITLVVALWQHKWNDRISAQ